MPAIHQALLAVGDTWAGDTELDCMGVVAICNLTTNEAVELDCMGVVAICNISNVDAVELDCLGAVAICNKTYP